MSEEPIERKLAELFETRLQDFFAKSIPEKLEEAAKHFERIEIGHRLNGQFFPTSAIQYPVLKAISVKVSGYIENAFDKDAHSSHKEFKLLLQDREFKNYLVNKWQEAFFLLTPLFLTTFYLFDETGSELLSEELRNEMLCELGLDTAQKRRDICLKYLGQLLLDGKVKHGGSEGFWNKEKRFQLLLLYNRFFFVVKNARSDYRQLEKKKLSDVKIREQIQEKYKIPAECIGDISKQASNADIALKWAKRELQSDDSNEHLRNRILRQARIENRITRQDGTLVLVVDFFEDETGTHTYTTDPKNKAATRKLQYISPYTLHPPEPPKIESR
jgi:hypothetical protein